LRILTFFIIRSPLQPKIAPFDLRHPAVPAMGLELYSDIKEYYQDEGCLTITIKTNKAAAAIINTLRLGQAEIAKQYPDRVD
jgi:hypothetical protein